MIEPRKFYGGPADGRIIEIETDTPYYKVPEYAQVENEGTVPIPRVVRVWCYVPTVWRTSEWEYTFMIPEGWTDVDFLFHLNGNMSGKRIR